ncbi:MAG: UDP-N-acetylmuramoylalanyl-D-glutamyl-2, 6-diaminopimelate--D-alanyl-D-alanine ligase [Nitratiruptor sp.]|nr:UDP-N-acetylmuramoylalanyl-D-glutamyl-2, 6-diaminopimelate--D-alanyl-D-alanine ligase [Nitratiruptor sp.]NPA83223.1 UDP-N-acetylmuramoyl-tripeptide--D-alanyl-D-alanine ligase [Campylobacterota bacterium]
MIFLHLLGHLVLVLLLGYYLILNLQWYNYKLDRILLHHHAPWLHIPFFLLPIFAYLALGEWVWVWDLLFGAILWWWVKRQGRGLVFTGRVKRFFAILFLATLTIDTLCLLHFGCSHLSTIAPLAIALALSFLLERLLLEGYKREALKRLAQIDPTIVAITASYGKTSIKNFLYQLVREDFRAYKTPRSVNTLAGIVQDINTALPANTQLYIVEAGAREPGDIAQIASLLRHHYAIIGKIGPQHLEYFKSLERIVATKLELLESDRLKMALVWDGIKVDRPEVRPFGMASIRNLHEDLEGITFELEIDGRWYPFQAPILGGFNALNIAAAILMAKELGVAIERLQQRVARLQGVPHRLQPIRAGGKLIIDDSFNGNLEGMVASYRLVRLHPGRKIVVTPGIMESGEEANKKLAQAINEVFDLAIITGRVNRKIFQRELTIPAIFLEEKGELEKLLAQKSAPGDLILFSNDAPGYL